MRKIVISGIAVVGLAALTGCGQVESGEAGSFTKSRPRKMPNL